MVLKLKKMLLSTNKKVSYLEAGDPLGIPVILLHGLGDSCRTFELLLRHFPENIRAIAYTQRGHDGIDTPDTSYKVADFEADLLHFMKAADIEKAFILGASSGGFAARRFAAHYPKRTLGLILVGTPSSLADKPEVVRTQETAIFNLTDPIPAHFAESFNEGLFTRPVSPSFLKRLYKDSQKIPARVWKETAAGLLKEKFPAQLHLIKASTLLVGGGKDPIVTREEQEKLAGSIADVRLTIFPQLAHMLYWEDPENVASEITAFINDVCMGPDSAKFEYE